MFSETSKVGAPLSALEKANLDAFIKKWKDKGVRNYVTRYDTDAIKLHDLFVPKEQRKQGIGTQYMNNLINLADRNGKRIILTTGQKEQGSTTSSTRLKDFYKRFGFVENKGRNKDFSISGNMYRNSISGSSGLQFPKPLEQPTFDERWRERVPEGEMPVPAIRDFPTNYKPPERFLEKRPVRLTKMPPDFNPFTNKNAL